LGVRIYIGKGLEIFRTLKVRGVDDVFASGTAHRDCLIRCSGTNAEVGAEAGVVLEIWMEENERPRINDAIDEPASSDVPGVSERERSTE
jgi:hypothetical protein